MSAKEWSEKVEAFLEESQELADDPTLGEIASQRLLRETMDILVPLSEELNEVTNSYANAAEDLEEVVNDPHASSSTVHVYEKPYEALRAKYEVLLYCQEKLEPFRAKVHDVYMRNTTMIEIQSVDEIPQFKSEAEEAEFWSTHSLGEALLDEMKPLSEDVLPRKESFLKRLFR